MAEDDRDIDPRGLIAEAYRMDIGPAECRSIFLDWLIGLSEGAGPDEIARLLTRHGGLRPDHPMTAVLREGVSRPAAPRPRRGRRAPPRET